jgi:5-methylcytosine-specific restriction endonuclease McrA
MARLIRDREPEAVEITEQAGKWSLLEWFCAKWGDAPLPPKFKKKERGRERLICHTFADDEFLASYQWRRLRMEVIGERGARCECCGASPRNGRTVINVDHIQPRRLFPKLALDKDNLQVLCDVCNHGKGNWDRTDWRLPESPDVMNERTLDEKRPIEEAASVPSQHMRPRLVKRRK